MQLARFLNSVFKKDGFILIDANSKRYIIGNPKNENPITLRILNKNLHYKLLFHPDLYFGEAYTNGVVKFENGEDENAKIMGFTLRNGLGSDLYFIFDADTPTGLDTSIISGVGGGMQLKNSKTPGEANNSPYQSHTSCHLCQCAQYDR